MHVLIEYPSFSIADYGQEEMGIIHGHRERLLRFGAGKTVPVRWCKVPHFTLLLQVSAAVDELPTSAESPLIFISISCPAIGSVELIGNPVGTLKIHAHFNRACVQVEMT